MKILITGIHGFIGSQLAADLGNMHEIYGLAKSLTPVAGAKRIFSWDKLHSNDIPDVDVIIHLAGIAHDTTHHTPYHEFFRINTGLTTEIYDYFKKSEATTFMFFSSVATTHSVNGTLTETTEPKPSGAYGESKLEAEKYIAASPVPDCKRVYILRPCLTYGKGDKGNLALLRSAIKRFGLWPLGAFDNRRSFLSIDNLKFIIRKLLDKPVQSGIYNLCDDEPLSTNDIVRIISENIGRKTRIVNVNPHVISIIAYIGGILHLPLNPERLKKLTENFIVSNAKIKQALGIERLPVKAAEGFRNNH